MRSKPQEEFFTAFYMFARTLEKFDKKLKPPTGVVWFNGVSRMWVDYCKRNNMENL